jgi:hypothetical protein
MVPGTGSRLKIADAAQTHQNVKASTVNFVANIVEKNPAEL